MNIIKPDTFVVFDLDDTLFSERDYQVSGFKAVSELVKNIYGHALHNTLLEWRDAGVSDIFGRLCEVLKLPASAKEEFIWVYRLHQPQIHLAEGASDVLYLLKERTAGVAILTDGRSTGQRLKIAALNLQDFPVYISDEWNSTKPMPERFSAIQKNQPASSYVYVGDNPAKDFKAPNELGWTTIGVRGTRANIHPQHADGLAAIFHPDVWISTITELANLLHSEGE